MIISHKQLQVVKASLALLLFLCLLKMPYGYYQLVRYIASGTFIFLALSIPQNDEIAGGKRFVYISLAVLFQPLLKIALGRTIWNIVDIIIGVLLLVSVILEVEKKK